MNNIDFDKITDKATDKDNDNNDNKLKWKCNLKAISENEDKIHGFPDTHYMSIYDKYSLFLGGTVNSDRLTNQLYLDSLEYYFPNSSIHLLNGGHFIHRTHYKQVEHEIVQYIKTVIIGM